MSKKVVNYVQGKYTPRYPHKYTGDVNTIIYRSSYELQFMHYCDNTPYILHWSSEEVVIPYIKPTDNRTHRYFIDFWMEYLSEDYEYDEDYWYKIDINSLDKESFENVYKIQHETHETIQPLTHLMPVPSNKIGRIQDFYVCETNRDIFIKVPGKIKKDANGKNIHKIKRVLIEVKPYNQTIEPKKQTRMTNSYKKRCMTYMINRAKWASAEHFAEKGGMEFKIITEKWLRNAR